MQNQHIQTTHKLGIENQLLISRCLDMGRFHDIKQLQQIDAQLQELLHKANFNPNQPRDKIGRWTDSGGGNARKYPIPKVGKAIAVKDPRTGKIPERANIFIGGAGDQTSNHNVEDSHALHRDIYGSNYYFTNEDGDKINELIKKLPKFMEINIIGHSWGGDTATEVVSSAPNRIRTLVTLDPVSTGLYTPYRVVNSSVN